MRVTKDKKFVKNNSKFKCKNQTHDKKIEEVKLFRSGSEKTSGKLRENSKTITLLTPFLSWKNH